MIMVREFAGNNGSSGATGKSDKLQTQQAFAETDQHRVDTGVLSSGIQPTLADYQWIERQRAQKDAHERSSEHGGNAR
jgi:hypothetical protein